MIPQVSKKFLKPKAKYQWQFPIVPCVHRGYGCIYIGFKFIFPVVRIAHESISTWLGILDDELDEENV